MKILFLTVGSELTASSRTRVYQYLPHLKKKGYKFKVIPFASDSFSNIQAKLGQKLGLLMDRIYKAFKIIKFLFLCPFFDIVFIQKVAFLPIWFQKIVRLSNEHIIFDFDDAIYLTDKERTKTISNESIKLDSKFFHMVSISKCILLENKYTKGFIRKYNSNIHMITGPIDTDRYLPKPQKKSSEVVIGWIGSQSTTMYLKLLKGPLYALSLKYPNIKVELIGASPIKLKSIKMEIKQWSLDSEMGNLQNFDIGIMCLPNNPWTQGKGGYKLLQYMAIGIPCVASPVGINKEIIIDGINGFLCESSKDWEEKLSILIENPELRNSMGKKGRKGVEAFYSLKTNASKLINILEKTNK